ncbi:MAG: hypothetical protein QXF65_03630 [Candidatus Korarchaeota archaeon]
MTLPQGIELAIAYILDKIGGKASLDEIHKATGISKLVLRKYLWHCQRRKLIKKDLGVYYITNTGLEVIRRSKILNIGYRMLAVVFYDRIELITLGRKSRIRAVRKDIIVNLLRRGLISRDEIKNSPNRREILAALRILRVLRLTKSRGNVIYISQDGVDRLLTIGIDPSKVYNTTADND